MLGYSNLMHILFTTALKQTDPRTSFFEIVSMKF